MTTCTFGTNGTDLQIYSTTYRIKDKFKHTRNENKRIKLLVYITRKKFFHPKNVKKRVKTFENIEKR